MNLMVKEPKLNNFKSFLKMYHHLIRIEFLHLMMISFFHSYFIPLNLFSYIHITNWYRIERMRVTTVKIFIKRNFIGCAFTPFYRIKSKSMRMFKCICLNLHNYL